MLDDVKIMMDETSRQSLDMLRRSLSEVLEPISRISDIGQKVSDLEDSVAGVSKDVSRKVDDLTDSLDFDSLKNNLRLLLQGQEKIFKEISKLTENANELKAALTQIDWDTPASK